MTRTDHLMEKLAVAFPGTVGKKLHDWMKKKKESDQGTAPTNPSQGANSAGPGASATAPPESKPSQVPGKPNAGSLPSAAQPTRPGLQTRPGKWDSPRPKCPGWLKNKIKKGDVTKAQANKMLKQGNYALIEKIAAGKVGPTPEQVEAMKKHGPLSMVGRAQGKVGKPSPSSPTTKPRPNSPNRPWAHLLPNKPNPSKC